MSNDPPEYEDPDLISHVGRALEKKHLAFCKERGLCPECSGRGVVDCGGIDIGCSSCDGSGKCSE